MKDPEEVFKGNVPFHAWQCLTICLENREVDLVIPNEK